MLAILERACAPSISFCGLTASGRTPFVLGALGRARDLRAKTLLVTCNPARRRAAAPWDVEIDFAHRGRARHRLDALKAGTATKVVLNLLSTAAMVRLGRVRGNRMIDVGVSNENLRTAAPGSWRKRLHPYEVRLPGWKPPDGTCGRVSKRPARSAAISP